MSDFKFGLEYKYVLGMDPGGTTGIALLRYTDETSPELIYLHQIEGGKEGFFEWFNGAAPGADVTLVSEQWDEHNIKGADRAPIYIEGIQYALWQDDIVYQTPDMKSLVPDEQLKRNNLWTPGKRHQMDALIHALVYLRNNDHKPTLRALSDEEEFEQPIADEGDADRLTLTEEEVEAMLGHAPGESEESGEDGEGSSDGDGEGAEEAEGAADASEVGDSDAEPTSSGGDNRITKDPDLKEHIPEGKRKSRERNGAFAGFDSAEGEITELYVD